MAEAVLTRENPEVCGQVIKELTAGQDRKTGNYNDFWDKRNYVKMLKCKSECICCSWFKRLEC